MGLFGSKQKKAGDKLKLICKSGDAGSYKCIFLASYRKLPVEIEWGESSVLEDKMSASMKMSGLERYPCIEDGDFTVCGASAVLTYLNIKGQTPSIHPRKARVLAMQQYWTQVLRTKCESIMGDLASNVDQATAVLESLDNNLVDKNYIVGEFSLADIHWSAVCKVLEEEGHGDMLSKYGNISKWLTKMKTEIPGYDTKAEKVAA